MTTARRGARSRLAVCLAVGGLLLAVAPAAQAAPAPTAGRQSAPAACAPQASATHPGAQARTRGVRRVSDHPEYTEPQLRRLDRRLERTLDSKEAERQSGRARAGLRFRIPVHVHVINGHSSKGPSTQRVRTQIQILNRAYSGRQSTHNAPTRFRFYLASLDRTRNQRWYTASLFDRADRTARRSLHRGGRHALNLYISAPTARDSAGAVLGYATMPWDARQRRLLDGVTVHKASMRGGGFRHYDRGDTAVHEVGHWLGLLHTFEGGCQGRNDRVEDTASQRWPTTGCPRGSNTCSAPGRDPIHNFMDYSYDTCMNRFTRGQVGRMTDHWLAYRTR